MVLYNLLTTTTRHEIVRYATASAKSIRVKTVIREGNNCWQRKVKYTELMLAALHRNVNVANVPTLALTLAIA